MAQILNYKPWHLENGNNWQVVQIQAGQAYDQGIIVKLDGYDTPEQARLLAGKKIAVPRSQLPVLAKNEYYWADLIDLSVINQNGKLLGKVIYLMATGANDVIVIKHNGKELAIPYLPNTVVTQIDLVNRMIHVNWEPGDKE
ncbi:MAG: 16S rRNA-processing protein RimM [uncultured bacterium]|nr:MAG: 16S rRNA-processing protein RimM [uncultured bacterium]